MLFYNELKITFIGSKGPGKEYVMGRKDWKKDFIMCKIYKDVACCGCGECLEKPKEYEYKKTDVWNVWMDERPVMVRQENCK